MNLHKATESEYEVIKALFLSAFPRSERAPFFLIKRRAFQDKATMLVAEEGGEFIGFVYTVSYKNLVYLHYLAVAEDKRGGGNGSEILRLLKLYFEDKNIFLAREPLDDTAENSQERINRRNFYIHNGFIDLPYQVREATEIYDLMSTNEFFDPSDYNVLIRNWAGKLVMFLIKMEIIE